MTTRPIYVPSSKKKLLVETFPIEFKWHPGFAKSQSQKNISALHDAAKKILDINKILEISSKSENELGVMLSAFNLMVTTPKGRKFSLECAYQASKVFEYGGPYVDLLDKSSIEAKKDPRLKNSGDLKYFIFFGRRWELQPTTSFYDWLYINTLNKNEVLAEEVLRYDAFTDIVFTPGKSYNCQAYAAALYVSLMRRGIMDKDVVADQDAYLGLINTGEVSNAHEDNKQLRIV